MVEFVLPDNLSLHSLLKSTDGFSPAPNEVIVIDFIRLSFVQPSGLAPLAALIDRWLSSGHKVHFQNVEGCASFEYLQRMDFFKLFDVFQTEKFVRHPTGGRFTTLRQINIDTDAKILATELVGSIVDDGPVGPELRDCLYESINNVIDHAGVWGYAMAQSYRDKFDSRRYCIAIADSGKGIRETLRNNSQLVVPDDRSALDLSCKARVSGSAGVKNEDGNPRNMGLGLFEIDQRAATNDGLFILCSGNAIRTRCGNYPIRYQQCIQWQGTILSVELTDNGIMKRMKSIQAFSKVAKFE